MNSERPDTRQHILECGQQLVAAKGFVGVGLAEILTTAGVPKGSFYHYFASKEAFGVALLEHYQSCSRARLSTLDARTDLNGAERLLSFFTGWAESQSGTDMARNCLIVKLSAEMADLSEAMRERMLGVSQAMLQRLTSYIQAGQADGSIRNPQEAAALAQWLYAAWLGASLLAKLRRDNSAFAGALERTRELLQQI